jgi:sugar phosphate isomerase/epimerase
LDEIIEFAAQEGFQAMEVSSGQLGLDRIDNARADELKARLKEKGVSFSSIAHYANFLSGVKEEHEALFKKAVDVAVLLDVDVVCGLAGVAPGGSDKSKVIREEAVPYWRGLADYASDKGVKIAFENWYRTLLENLEHWRICFEEIGRDNVGLNFDPSHLFWQGIDYLAAVDMFKDRIFHTHAKDTEVKQEKLKILGCRNDGWWRYVIPGYGGIDWGAYVSRLRGIRYEGVLSIEHEDGTFGVEEGLRKGLKHLSMFV